MSRKRARRRAQHHGGYTLACGEVLARSGASEDQFERAKQAGLVTRGRGYGPACRYAEATALQMASLLRTRALGGSDEDAALVLLLERRPPPQPSWVKHALLTLVDRWRTAAMLDRLRRPTANSVTHLARSVRESPVVMRQLAGVPYHMSPALLPDGGMSRLEHTIPDRAVSVAEIYERLEHATDDQVRQAEDAALRALNRHDRTLYSLFSSMIHAVPGTSGGEQELAGMLLFGFGYAPHVSFRRAMIPWLMVGLIFRPTESLIPTTLMLLEALGADLEVVESEIVPVVCPPALEGGPAAT